MIDNTETGNKTPDWSTESAPCLEAADSFGNCDPYFRKSINCRHKASNRKLWPSACLSEISETTLKTLREGGPNEIIDQRTAAAHAPSSNKRRARVVRGPTEVRPCKNARFTTVRVPTPTNSLIFRGCHDEHRFRPHWIVRHAQLHWDRRDDHPRGVRLRNLRR